MVDQSNRCLIAYLAYILSYQANRNEDEATESPYRQHYGCPSRVACCCEEVGNEDVDGYDESEDE